MGRTGNVPHLRFVLGVIGVEFNRDRKLEKLFVFVPIGLNVEVNCFASRGENPNQLHAGRINPCGGMNLYSIVFNDDIGHRTVGDNTQRIAVEGIQIPSVPHIREVLMNMEFSGLLTGGNPLTIRFNFSQRGQFAACRNTRLEEGIRNFIAVVNLEQVNTLGVLFFHRSGNRQRCSSMKREGRGIGKQFPGLTVLA